MLNTVFFSGDIATSAILHLASCVPSRLHFGSTDFNSYNAVSTGVILGASGGPAGSRERLSAPEAPGLGVEPRWEVLGEPVYVCEG